MSFRESYRQARDQAIASHEHGTPARPERRAPRDPRHSPRHEDAGSPAFSLSSPPPIQLGFYNGDRTKPIHYYGERHALIYGLNGAGKSTRFLIELLMTTSHRSLFIYDIKGELCFQTFAERKRYSKAKRINPYNLHGMGSDGHNPLARLSARDPLLYDMCAAIADALIEIEAGSGQFWSEAAQGLLTALIMWEVIEAAREKRKPSLYNVRLRLTEADEYESYIDASGKARRRLVKGLSLTAARMVESGNDAIASLASRFVAEHGQNTLAGIQQTAATQTEWMLSQPMRADLEKDGTDFSEMRREPVSIFVCCPADQVTLKRRWNRLLLASALNAHLVPGPVSSLFVLDEFRASVGKLSIVSDMWSLVRGFGVQLMPILQSVVQLKVLFKEEWQNYNAQAGLVATLGPVNDEDTANWMSSRSGVTTILQAAYNEGAGTSAGDGVNAGSGVASGGASTNQGSGLNFGNNVSGGLSYSQVERRVLLPQELMDLKAGEGRIWLPGLGSESVPFYAPNYWQRREPWVARVKPNPYRRG